MRQLSFFSHSLVHGGSLARPGKRKQRRPLCSKRPLHLVLRSRGNLYSHRAAILPLVRRQCALQRIRLYECAVAADHLHLLLRPPGRAQYRAFLRAFTGLLARKLGKGLFSLLPFSRVASWGRDFSGLKAYLQLNREEAAGIRPYRPRKHRKPPGSGSRARPLPP